MDGSRMNYSKFPDAKILHFRGDRRNSWENEAVLRAKYRYQLLL